MAYKVFIKTPAKNDLIQALEWYQEKDKKLAKDLLIKINEVIQSIKENPFQYRKKYQKIRVAFTRKFPYGIYFSIEKNEVFIHAILHNKQNPKTGIKRV